MLKLSNKFIVLKKVFKHFYSKQIEIETLDISRVKKESIYVNEKIRNTYGIAIAFDKNYLHQAMAMLYSLLLNCRMETNYHVYCLVDTDINRNDIKILKGLFQKFKKHDCTVIHIPNIFENAFEVRGITRVSYFRLLLYKILPELTSILYIDVDTIILDDLSGIKIKKEYFVKAVKTKSTLSEKIISEYNLDSSQYFNSGVIKINLDAFRNSNSDKKITELLKFEFPCVDQDILNILCMNKIEDLHPKYNVHGYIRADQMTEYYSKNILDEAIHTPSIIHWTGQKPWQNIDIDRAEIWWVYSKKIQSEFKIDINPN